MVGIRMTSVRLNPAFGHFQCIWVWQGGRVVGNVPLIGELGYLGGVSQRVWTQQ